MTRFLPTFLTAAAAGLALALLAGCGKSTPTAEADPADGIRTIRISANDQMRFSLNLIEASPGEQLRVSLSNFGRMSKQTMGHNWVLFAQMDESTLNMLSMDASQNSPDYLPKDMSKVLQKTKLLGPGETDSVVFTVPTEPGEYPFACTFPGHFALMRGKLVVK